MPDLIAISQGLSALKATSDIVKALIGLRDYAQILEKTVELNQQIATAQAALISAHQEQSSLLDQVHALEKEITDMETWNAKKDDYELCAVSAGALAYMLKQSTRGTEPPHWLCTNCYENSKPSIMQAFGEIGGKRIYKCPRCENTFRTYDIQVPEWIDKK